MLGFSLDGIPQEITGHEHVGIVDEECVEPSLDRDDPLELQGVVRHGLTVAVGVDDCGSRRTDEGAHDLEGPRVPVNALRGQVSHGIGIDPQGQPGLALPADPMRAPRELDSRPAAPLGYGESVPKRYRRCLTSHPARLQPRAVTCALVPRFVQSRTSELGGSSMLAALVLSVFTTISSTSFDFCLGLGVAAEPDVELQARSVFWCQGWCRSRTRSASDSSSTQATAS